MLNYCTFSSRVDNKQKYYILYEKMLIAYLVRYQSWCNEVEDTYLFWYYCSSIDWNNDLLEVQKLMLHMHLYH